MSTDATPGPDSGRSQRAAALVSAGIFISRISGLIRTQLTAAVLGGGGVADAFVAAFRIPNLLQNLLGEGVLSASFIPVYSQSLDEEDEKRSSQLAGAIGGLLGLFHEPLRPFPLTLHEHTEAVLAGHVVLYGHLRLS